ncbi:MAG: DUF3592 domain-containing protein [Planctomycetales bacterium]|nr:DUF3592 domain-containing protein [Planctomycetales bacterium]
MKQYWPILLGVGIIAIGVAILWTGYRDLLLAVQSTNWPTAIGVVKTSLVEHEVTKQRDADGRREVTDTYYARIGYQYTVAGRQYSSDRVAMRDYSWADKNEATEITERYPTGSEVTVFHSPTDPSVAVLRPGLGWGNVGPLFFGIMLSAVGAFVVLLALPWRTRRELSDAHAHLAKSIARDHTDLVLPVRLTGNMRRGTRIITGFLVGTCLTAVAALLGWAVYSGQADQLGQAIGLGAVAAVIGGLGIVMLVGCVLGIIGLRIHQVIVEIDRDGWQVGEEVAFCVRQKGPLHLNALKVYLRCEQTEREQFTQREKDGERTNIVRHLDRIVYDQLVAEAHHVHIASEEFFDLHGQLTIPAGLRATGWYLTTEFQWELVVIGNIPWFPDYLHRFPVRVIPAPGDELPNTRHISTVEELNEYYNETTAEST